ncbi:MAG TPA: hypothetical protein VJQ82_05300 [Terriglobales bacterium]|nr:hypothetical protein [Terriglobales bacterium]
MTVYLVFNELSANHMSPSVEVARGRLRTFSDILIDPRIKGQKRLVTPPEFPQLQIAAGYSVGRWLCDRGWGDPDRRVRIKTLIDKCDYYQDCVPPDELESHAVEYRCADELARGLFVAFSVDGLAVSFSTENRWDSPAIELYKYWLDGDNVQSRSITVVHVCRTDHLDDHREWLRQQEPLPPTSGAELWNRKDWLFPNLDFCESAEEQIKNLKGDDHEFRAVARGMCDLQNYCATWNSSNFDIHLLNNASGESASTLQMYSEERTFRCPDGAYRLFNWHLKRGDVRIHFFDFPKSKRILVGYVGRHLRIAGQ